MLDPLSEPQPSEETGPGTHLRPESAISKTITRARSANSVNRLSKSHTRHSLSSMNPYRSPADVSDARKQNLYPSPPQSASPRQNRFPTDHRQEAFSGHGPSQNRTRNRGSSLGERFTGDISHRPLERIKKDAKSANRSPHLRKSHQIPPDTIDSLSTVGGGVYHHEGPYDAALFARNTSDKTSPLKALDDSTTETLKATPREKIIDSIRGHRPLDGVAAYAPGDSDRNGHIYRYEQGDNMMVSGNPEGGAYKRWPGVDYHPDDVKGKGEPSYSIERALKGHDGGLEGHRQASNRGDIEMTSRPNYAGATLSNAAGTDAVWGDGQESGLRRTTGSLKKKLGNIRKRLRRDE